MNRDQALAIVKEQLTEHRYVHTIGVMETAAELAQRYGETSKKQKQLLFFTIMQSSAARKK